MLKNHGKKYTHEACFLKGDVLPGGMRYIQYNADH